MSFYDRYVVHITVAVAMAVPSVLWLMLIIVKPWLRMAFAIDTPDGVTP